MNYTRILTKSLAFTLFCLACFGVSANNFPPKTFEAKGKFSVITPKNNYLLDIIWEQDGQNTDVRLSSSKYTWELNLAQDPNGDWVDNQRIEEPLSEWLLKNYQFDFPIDDLKRWIFYPEYATDKRVKTVTMQNWNGHKVMKKIRIALNNHTSISVLVRSITTK